MTSFDREKVRKISEWYRREITVVKSKKMEEEDEQQSVQRLEAMFKHLDRNGNGRIDVQDLTAALKGFGMSLQYAEVSISAQPRCVYVCVCARI